MKALTINERKASMTKAALSLCVICLLLIGCSNDDGPSTTERLVGDWELVEFNGINVSGYSLDIDVESDGDYREVWVFDGTSFSYRGEWKLVGDVIEIDYDDGDYMELELKEVTGVKLLVENEDRDEFEFEKD